MTIVGAARWQSGVASPAQHARRNRMLDATVTLGAEGGFDAVQMREVAERAGVALGTLYRYFPSKIHLLVAALGRELAASEERTTTRAIPGDTARERVTVLLGGMTQALQRRPQLTEALVRALMFADASVSAEIDLVGAQLSRMIARGIAGDPGHSEASDEEAAVIRIVADVWFAALVRWVTGRSPAADVERSVEVAVRRLLA